MRAPSLIFGNTDVFALFGNNAFNESLDGSFLLTSFSPNANASIPRRTSTSSSSRPRARRFSPVSPGWR